MQSGITSRIFATINGQLAALYFILPIDVFGGDGHAYNGQGYNSEDRLHGHDRHGSGHLDHGAKLTSMVRSFISASKKLRLLCLAVYPIFSMASMAFCWSSSA